MPSRPETFSRWEPEEYVAGYRARLSALPDSESAHWSRHCGWEDADTEVLESIRHKRLISEGIEDHYSDTWGVLFDAGVHARQNGIPFDSECSQPWKEGWIEKDIGIGVHNQEAELG